ncbi:MAG TPA: hypothetical protein VJ715_02320, partial [Pyrinomonadaceae bacterium]|nr:hypothetical protein [Pyrinomonadaceae bacterium]
RAGHFIGEIRQLYFLPRKDESAIVSIKPTRRLTKSQATDKTSGRPVNRIAPRHPNPRPYLDNSLYFLA